MKSEIKQEHYKLNTYYHLQQVQHCIVLVDP